MCKKCGNHVEKMWKKCDLGELVVSRRKTLDSGLRLPDPWDPAELPMIMSRRG